VEALTETHKRDANAHSITAAHLAVAVYQLGGAKDEFTADRFLPYPTQQETGISNQTARVFVELLDAGLLPAKVVSASSKYITEIARFQ
jgi:hypothetical protein